MKKIITTIAFIIMVSALSVLKAQDTSTSPTSPSATVATFESAASSDAAEILLPVSSPVEEGTIIVAEGVGVGKPELYHSGDFLKIGLQLDLSELNVKANRAVLLTPHIVVADVDSLDLPSVSIYGRQRYYYYLRRNETLTADEKSYRAKEKPDSIDYVQLTLFPEWAMNQELEVHLRRTDYGCCNSVVDQWDSEVARIVKIPPYAPAIVYVQPTGQIPLKERSISGSANITYVVNKTDIRETYRGNAAELGKIRKSIDSVKDDPDVTITKIHLKGYASPEGSYAHNVELAKGRVASLKDYVSRLYGFEEGLVGTDFEPEDWAGLRAYVDGSDLEHRAEILALIDGDLEPDPKEWKIKSTYPEEYRFLLGNVYPTLRHTEYKVDYIIREYTEIEDIQNAYETQPDKLGPNEFYLLSQQYEAGSDEFARVFETAAALYPDDETANLNAANAALGRFEFDKAEEYLQKAGQSGEAEYARGVLSYWQADYDAAIGHMHKAQDAGVEAATDVLGNIEGVDPARIEIARQSVLDEIAAAQE